MQEHDRLAASGIHIADLGIQRGDAAPRMGIDAAGLFHHMT